MSIYEISKNGLLCFIAEQNFNKEMQNLGLVYENQVIYRLWNYL